MAQLDPARPEVALAVSRCREAGIRPVMITGDHPLTARAIGASISLVEPGGEVVLGRQLEEADDAGLAAIVSRCSVYARVPPEQKLRIVKAFQGLGQVVAMTGDGVNDAPALKQAHIGVAMGITGTEVSKEAADMVLKDDAFATIVVAIRQGRTIFDNIRKFVLYLLSCNVAEILIVGLASIANAPLPIRPLQILFLNLVTDVFPALALGVGEGGDYVMQRPPRDPEEPIIGRSQWIAVGGYSALITIGVLLVLWGALSWQGMPQEQAVTLSFLTLAFAQIWHVFNMRSRGSGLFRNDVTRNPWVWGAVVLCIGLLLVAVYVPFFADLLALVPPGPVGWTMVGVGSLAPFVVIQVIKEIRDATS